MKISIVVPVYNTERYLEKCITSILKQTFTDYEILLIDDGSTDKSLEICREMEKKDNRITVYSKKNGGLADTRNFGMKYAVGEYICFLDSDDWFEENMLTQYVNALKKCKNSASVVIQGFCVEFTNENSSFKKGFKRDVFFSERDMWRGVLEAEREGLFNSSCNKLYKLDVLLKNNIKYEVGSEPAEDLIFNCKVFPLMQEIVCSSYIGYHYIKRNVETLTVKFMPDYEKRIMNFYEARKELYGKIAMPADEKKIWLSSSLASYTLTAVSNLYRKNVKLNFKIRSKKIGILKKQPEILMALKISKYCDMYIKVIRYALNLPGTILPNIILSIVYGCRYKFEKIYIKLRKKILYSNGEN